EDALTAIDFGTTFEQVAADTSVAPDRYAGGDVGFVPLDALPTEVADVAKTLPKGDVSPVIETRYGYFIITVEDVKTSGPMALDEVEDEISDLIRAEKEAKAYQEWLDQLRGKAKIDIDEKILKKI
ncbi:MAG: peptidyl-prolyl cis-trans isomerase, partial [Candidatus Dadabacteria bacterium]|nr:peptidyl-prolyl cis-trans isomerase [Candidatus Dadabacteria bacterium]